MKKKCSCKYVNETFILTLCERNIPLLCQLLLQFLVPALMMAGDGDDNNEHEDQQPSGHRTHNDHQQVLHDLRLALTLCTVESLDISSFFYPRPPFVTLDYLSAGR